MLDSVKKLAYTYAQQLVEYHAIQRAGTSSAAAIEIAYRKVCVAQANLSAAAIRDAELRSL